MNMIKTAVYVLRLINQFLEEKKNTQEQPKPGAVNPTWKVLERVCLGEVPSYYLRSHWRVNSPPEIHAIAELPRWSSEAHNFSTSLNMQRAALRRIGEKRIFIAYSLILALIINVVSNFIKTKPCY